MPTLPKTMQAVYLTGHGGMEVLRFVQDAPVPEPKADEVVIKVGAAGINNTDINTRIGWYSRTVTNGTTQEGSDQGFDQANTDDAGWNGALTFPRIQGADICGRIVAVGSDVESSRMGERVIVDPCLRQGESEFAYIGSEINGGFAQYTSIPARAVYAIECDWTDTELATLPCAYSTAENLLTRANVNQHDRVLITGASGGVGSAAVQLAKRRGAEVIAVANPRKAETLESLGASQVVGREADLLSVLGENSVTVVIDLVAGERWPVMLELLKPLGRYAVSGAIAGPIVSLDVRTLYLKDISFFGCTRLEPQVFGNLVRYVEAGDIKPALAGTFALNQITDAQQAFLDKTYTGKLVLIP